METLESNSDYIECKLDENEFKQKSYDLDQSFSSLQEVPLYIWTLLLFALTYLVSPITNSETYSTITAEGKRTKKNIIKQIKQLMKKGQEQDDNCIETAFFYTDQEQEDSLSSTAGYEKLGSATIKDGVFYV